MFISKFLEQPTFRSKRNRLAYNLVVHILMPHSLSTVGEYGHKIGLMA